MDLGEFTQNSDPAEKMKAKDRNLGNTAGRATAGNRKGVPREGAKSKP